MGDILRSVVFCHFPLQLAKTLQQHLALDGVVANFFRSILYHDY
jgi:hypothetical protein